VRGKAIQINPANPINGSMRVEVKKKIIIGQVFLMYDLGDAE